MRLTIEGTQKKKQTKQQRNSWLLFYRNYSQALQKYAIITFIIVYYKFKIQGLN